MKKRFLPLLLILIMVLSVSSPALAASPRLTDDADLLSTAERTKLQSMLDEISNRQQFDVVIVTVDSLVGKSPMEYADDCYDYNGYGSDGVLLLVSMEYRDWWISTTGFGITAITDAGCDYISDKFLPYLSSGDYYTAFSTFARLCDEFVTQAKNGNAYDTGNLPKSPFPLLQNLAISLAVGFILAFICVSVMKSKLKTVRRQSAANSYIRAGSFSITDKRDMFLYSKVDRRIKPQPQSSSGGSSVHTSSSGMSHGGRGGKF